jgi:hypothetical protein
MRKRLTAVVAGAAFAFAANGAMATADFWDSLVSAPGSNASLGVPWIVSPAGGSSYAEWTIFDAYPTATVPNIAGSGSVTETTGAGFLTGGGNIYSFAAPTAFTASLASGGTGPVDVWLRIGTLGTAPLDSASLNGVAASRVETYNLALGGMGGDEKESYWKWTLATVPASYTFSFGAQSSSMSLDQVALYAAPVPEPGAWAMLLAGLAGVGVIARRRARSGG